MKRALKRRADCQAWNLGGEGSASSWYDCPHSARRCLCIVCPVPSILDSERALHTKKVHTLHNHSSTPPSKASHPPPAATTNTPNTPHNPISTAVTFQNHSVPPSHPRSHRGSVHSPHPFPGGPETRPDCYWSRRCGCSHRLWAHMRCRRRNSCRNRRRIGCVYGGTVFALLVVAWEMCEGVGKSCAGRKTKVNR